MIKIFIRELRRARHMTQKQLAEQIINREGKPLDQGPLSRYEKGKPIIPLDLALQIAKVLNCKIENLVEWIPDK